MKQLFPPLGGECRRLLDELPGLTDRVFPLAQRFRRGLSRDTAELSRLLTSGREDRNRGYLGETPLLSAYLRYFLPWNIYRLCRLLPALPLTLREGDALTDLGSGPLTLPMALWISRPELRSLPLEFRCLDRTGAALEAGVKLFRALAGPDSPWVLRTIRASLGERIYGKAAQLVSAVNLFNELFWDIPPGNRKDLSALAERQGRLLTALAGEGGSILVVEPGIPRSGEFLTALRTSLLHQDRPPLAPCPHDGPCPCPGGAKTKWCHFAFDTAGAPEALDRLSLAAGIPKERAVLSFLLTGPRTKAPDRAKPPEGAPLPVRILSDPFPLPAPREGPKPPAGAVFGRYGCSARGLVLVRGSREDMEQSAAGDLLEVPLPGTENRDPKSGALVVGYPSPIGPQK
ncbi:MAG: rRNA methyltransferase [Treponema sp.]|nr:rRNA methyltransferase [Treponema sp.]